VYFWRASGALRTSLLNAHCGHYAPSMHKCTQVVQVLWPGDEYRAASGCMVRRDPERRRRGRHGRDFHYALQLRVDIFSTAARGLHLMAVRRPSERVRPPQPQVTPQSATESPTAITRAPRPSLRAFNAVINLPAPANRRRPRRRNGVYI